MNKKSLLPIEQAVFIYEIHVCSSFSHVQKQNEEKFKVTVRHTLLKNLFASMYNYYILYPNLIAFV